jgi:hypothetical protein
MPTNSARVDFRVLHNLLLLATSARRKITTRYALTARNVRRELYGSHRRDKRAIMRRRVEQRLSREERT